MVMEILCALEGIFKVPYDVTNDADSYFQGLPLYIHLTFTKLLLVTIQKTASYLTKKYNFNCSSCIFTYKLILFLGTIQTALERHLINSCVYVSDAECMNKGT